MDNYKLFDYEKIHYFFQLVFKIIILTIHTHIFF
jgi:hypothetical protein